MDVVKFKQMTFNYKLARFTMLLKRHLPFLGEVISRVEKYKGLDDGQIAATDGLHLFLNVEVFQQLLEEEFNFLLLHELFHIILGHRYPKTVLKTEYRFWNIAADLIICWVLNQMQYQLQRAGLPFQPLKDVVWTSDDLSKDTTAVIAKEFTQQAIQQGMYSQELPLVVHLKWKSFEMDVPNDYALDLLADTLDSEVDTEREATAMLREAAKAAGNEGMPEVLKDFWQQLLKGKQLPWYLIFKQYLQGLMEDSSSDFCPPDKRLLYSDIILPAGSDTGRELNNALVVLDVSWSVSRDELAKQVWQLKRILDELDFNGELVSFASSIVQSAKLTTRDSLKKFMDDIKIGGGTEWGEVVNWVKSKRVQPRPIIVFTDGYFYQFTTGLKDVIFILQGDAGDASADLAKLGKIIGIGEK